MVELDEAPLNLFHDYRKAPRCPASKVVPGDRLCSVLTEAGRIVAPGKAIGVGHFLRAIAAVTRKLGEEPALGFDDQVVHSTFSIEILMWGLGYTAWTPLSKAPKVRDLFASIEGKDPTEHFEYLMTLEEGRIVFRPTSILSPYRLDTGRGLVRDGLGILTHFKDQYGALTASEILELEDLINNPRAREGDLQEFFERHPQLFRRWDYRDIFPHVYLTREEDGPLVPDFLLVDPEVQRAMILDLKLRQAKLVRRQTNRDRFASSITEARAQLLEYRDWFEDRANRERLKESVGMEIFRPHLGVVIGSSTIFRDTLERQKLAATYPDLEIVTYDKILASAQRRLALIRSATTRQ